MHTIGPVRWDPLWPSYGYLVDSYYFPIINGWLTAKINYIACAILCPCNDNNPKLNWSWNCLQEYPIYLKWRGLIQIQTLRYVSILVKLVVDAQNSACSPSTSFEHPTNSMQVLAGNTNWKYNEFCWIVRETAVTTVYGRFSPNPSHFAFQTTRLNRNLTAVPVIRTVRSPNYSLLHL